MKAICCDICCKIEKPMHGGGFYNVVVTRNPYRSDITGIKLFAARIAYNICPECWPRVSSLLGPGETLE